MKRRSNIKIRLIRTMAALLVVLTVLGTFMVTIDFRLRKVAHSFARAKVSAILTAAVNKAAYRILSEYNITYDSVSRIERGENNLVSSVEINTGEINRFKSGLTGAVLNELKKYNEITFSVPLFAAFGMYYTYLRYPKITYTMSVMAVVSTAFKSEFTEAGINQVLHKISVKVGTKGRLAVLGDDAEIGEFTDFTVAETVIVGAVPEAFTNIDYATEEIVDDVFDYGASQRN